MNPPAVSLPSPAAVRRAWGVDTLKPLDGGQGIAFVGGGVDLQPVLDPRQFAWLNPDPPRSGDENHLGWLRPRLVGSRSDKLSGESGANSGGPLCPPW